MTDEKFYEVNILKGKINLIQDEICEGIRVRAKIDERMNGEKISSYLLGKEKNRKSAMCKILRDDGSTVNNSKAILHEVRNYYENLFGEDEGNDSGQNDLF